MKRYTSAYKARTRVPPLRRSVSLTPGQMEIISLAAKMLPPEKKSVLLSRVASKLALRGRFTDADVSDALKISLYGLLQAESAA